MTTSCVLVQEQPPFKVEYVFQDCDNCPEIIVVPAGSFVMGSPSDEVNRGDDEGPLRHVTIAKDFAVGVYEITYDQWQSCFDERICRHNPADNGWGRGNLPVTDVSWLDAKEYVGWLSMTTEHEYRLLTEAEWEYAARAGSSGRFWWGDQSQKGRAVCAGCNLDGQLDIARSIGGYAPNPFGLYDVHGNVSEWVEDCWSETYENHPVDGSAWVPSQSCIRRVLRGGNWANGGRHLRSANRSWKRFDYRGMNGKGFRVAMTLPGD